MKKRSNPPKGRVDSSELALEVFSTVTIDSDKSNVLTTWSLSGLYNTTVILHYIYMHDIPICDRVCKTPCNHEMNLKNIYIAM